MWTRCLSGLQEQSLRNMWGEGWVVDVGKRFKCICGQSQGRSKNLLSCIYWLISITSSKLLKVSFLTVLFFIIYIKWKNLDRLSITTFSFDICISTQSSIYLNWQLLMLLIPLNVSYLSLRDQISTARVRAIPSYSSLLHKLKRSVQTVQKYSSRISVGSHHRSADHSHICIA